MNDSTVTREEMMSALFLQLVMQQTNMAMMLLGQVPHPQTGQTIVDLEAAKMFIDQLEMIQAKTKGNLVKEEESLLKQSLLSLQMTFVDAVAESEKPKKSETASAAAQKTAEKSQAQASEAAKVAPTTETAGDDSHKKFVKKY